MTGKGTIKTGVNHGATGGRGTMLWLTGLSGSGKSTLASAVRDRLITLGHAAYVIDGDRTRQGLCADLGFSRSDRAENVRRVGEAANLLVDAGLIVLAACISPFRDDRARVRAIFNPSQYVEIYCSASLSACEARDVKGLYAKARRGEIKEFTGVSSPYEPPLEADLCVDAGSRNVEESIAAIMLLLIERGVI
ncbi:MAG: adenylyl-sulfate kinase [Pseudomonadota bacterium]